MQKPFLLALAAALSWSSVALAEVPNVVATVKPLHALVAAVMGDLGTPALIVKGAASPHTYSLRPSDAQALQSANLVFWTGHGLEVFLEDSIGTLAPQATIVELSEAPGIELLAPRESGTFEEHADEEEAHEDHGHGEEADMHFFLDPANAKIMVATIADSLAAADPEHADTYRANAATETADLDALIAETEANLASVKDRPFVVFHDAYQYFETRYGLNAVGSITVSPERQPGAQRLQRLRRKIAQLKAVCVFAEPQFEPTLVQTVIERTPARTGVLDYMGVANPPGRDAYFDMMRGMARALVGCLKG
jgi:zinc transport system substrate-binding protein